MGFNSGFKGLISRSELGLLARTSCLLHVISPINMSQGSESVERAGSNPLLVSLRLRHPQRAPLSVIRTVHILIFRRLSLVKDKASKLILHKIRNLSFHTGYYSIMLQAPAEHHTPPLKPYEGLQEQHEGCL